MKYLLILVLLLLVIGCGKSPKTTPINKIDSPAVQKRVFRGEYLMFDSFERVTTSNYPPFPPVESTYKMNRAITIEIDSDKSQIVLGRDTFRRDSDTSSKYSRRSGPPRFWIVTEDSTLFYFWDSRSGHVQVDTYVKGYRKK